MKTNAQKILGYLKSEIKIIDNTMLNYPKTRKILIKQLIILKKAYQILRERVRF